MEKLKENSDCEKKIKEARISIRTTTTKKELLQLKAKASKMSLGEFLVAAGLDLKIKEVTPAINKSLYVELCRQGNNINQLARLQNTQAISGKDPELDVDDRKTLKDIRNLLDQILTELKEKAAN